MNKKVIKIIICSVVVISLIGLVITILTKEENSTYENKSMLIDNKLQLKENEAPSKIYEDEKEVTAKKGKELFEFIPKVYTEAIAPFNSIYMLDAVMQKIIDTDENQNFSVDNVDKIVTNIFGKDAKINKNEVFEPDVAKSLFYYSKEADSYAVIPVGYDGIFKNQIFKNATETDDKYFVYTYMLIGGYSYDEDSITQDEFGDVSYENARVQLVVGDKDGKDLTHIFANYTELYDESIWISKYSNIMPVFRYTLTKHEDGYCLTEVEQISY